MAMRRAAVRRLAVANGPNIFQMLLVIYRGFDQNSSLWRQAILTININASFEICYSFLIYQCFCLRCKSSIYIVIFINNSRSKPCILVSIQYRCVIGNSEFSYIMRGFLQALNNIGAGYIFCQCFFFFIS